MIIQTFLIWFCFFSACITYGLGIFVYAKNPSLLVNRLFLLVCCGATYWAAGEFLIWHTGGLEGTWFWLKFSSFWPLVIVLTFHFVLTYTGMNLPLQLNRMNTLLFVYGTGLLFSITGLFSDLIYTVTYLPEKGYYYTSADNSPVFFLVTFCILILIIWTSVYGIRSWFQSPPGRDREQKRLISMGIMSVGFFGFISGFLSPVFGLHTPNLVFVGIVIFSICIAYAILRYGLFILRPETAAHNIIKMMPDGLLIADMSGIIISANEKASDLLHVNETDLPGRSIISVLPPDIVYDISSRLRVNKSLYDYEVILTGKEIIIASISGSLVTGPGDDPAGFILIIRDITSRKNSEKALKLANEKISLLTRLTRHDISNLVTALSGYLTIVLDDDGEKKNQSYISASLELVDKISRHLQFSRQYQEIGMHEPVWQSLYFLISTAIGDLAHEGVIIRTNVDPVRIFCDPLTVKVFYNLLENALRHGIHLTCIEISTAIRSDGELILVFEDDGIGIPDNKKEIIFDHGYGTNTGLGLTLSRDILSVSGILLRETGKYGLGARFEVLIPKDVWEWADYTL